MDIIPDLKEKHLDMFKLEGLYLSIRMFFHFLVRSINLNNHLATKAIFILSKFMTPRLP